MLAEYDKMSAQYDFQTIDAKLPVELVAEQLKRRILPFLPGG